MTEAELPQPTEPELESRKSVRRCWRLVPVTRKRQKPGRAEEKIDRMEGVSMQANPSGSSGLRWLFSTISVTSVPGDWLSLG